jgi:hypothetical protein
MSNLREVFLRKLVLVAMLSALAIPVRAQSVQVYGKTGYLGEYELSSIVSEQVANGRREYSGPLAGETCRLVHPVQSEGNDRSN